MATTAGRAHIDLRRKLHVDLGGRTLNEMVEDLTNHAWAPMGIEPVASSDPRWQSLQEALRGRLEQYVVAYWMAGTPCIAKTPRARATIPGRTGKGQARALGQKGSREDQDRSDQSAHIAAMDPPAALGQSARSRPSPAKPINACKEP